MNIMGFIIQYALTIFVLMITFKSISTATLPDTLAPPDMAQEKIRIINHLLPSSNTGTLLKESSSSHIPLVPEIIKAKEVDKDDTTNPPEIMNELEGDLYQNSHLQHHQQKVYHPMESHGKSIQKRSSCGNCGSKGVIIVPVIVKKGGGCGGRCGKKKRVRPCGGGCGGGGGGGSFAYASASSFSYGR